MGWGRMMLLGDWGQQMDIGDLQQEVAALRAAARAAGRPDASVEERLGVLENELGQSKLYLAALVRILVGAELVTREELARIVAAVDAEDGAADGRFTGPVG